MLSETHSIQHYHLYGQYFVEMKLVLAEKGYIGLHRAHQCNYRSTMLLMMNPIHHILEEGEP